MNLSQFYAVVLSCFLGAKICSSTAILEPSFLREQSKGMYYKNSQNRSEKKKKTLKGGSKLLWCGQPVTVHLCEGIKPDS